MRSANSACSPPIQVPGVSLSGVNWCDSPSSAPASGDARRCSLRCWPLGRGNIRRKKSSTTGTSVWATPLPVQAISVNFIRTLPPCWPLLVSCGSTNKTCGRRLTLPSTCLSGVDPALSGACLTSLYRVLRSRLLRGLIWGQINCNGQHLQRTTPRHARQPRPSITQVGRLGCISPPSGPPPCARNARLTRTIRYKAARVSRDLGGVIAAAACRHYGRR